MWVKVTWPKAFRLSLFSLLFPFAVIFEGTCWGAERHEGSKGGGGWETVGKEEVKRMKRMDSGGGGEDPSVRHRAGVWAQESDTTSVWSHTPSALMSVWEGFKVQGLVQIRRWISASGKNGTWVWATIMEAGGSCWERRIKVGSNESSTWNTGRLIVGHTVYYILLTHQRGWGLMGPCCLFLIHFIPSEI